MYYCTHIIYTVYLYIHVFPLLCSIGTFPIDTTKTRLQIQGQIIDGRNADLKYKGMFHALLRISREEGMRALYGGYV